MSKPSNYDILSTLSALHQILNNGEVDLFALSTILNDEVRTAMQKRYLPEKWSINKKYVVCIPLCEEDEGYMVFSTGDIVVIDSEFSFQMTPNIMSEDSPDKEFLCVLVSGKREESAWVPVEYLDAFLMEYDPNVHN